MYNLLVSFIQVDATSEGYGTDAMEQKDIVIQGTSEENNAVTSL